MKKIPAVLFLLFSAGALNALLVSTSREQVERWNGQNPASNNGASPYGFAEGAPASQTNDVARATMSEIRRFAEQSVSSQFGVAGGTADAILITPAITWPSSGYISGQIIRFRTTGPNTVAAPTIKVSGMTTTATIGKISNSSLAAGDMKRNALVELIYDGSVNGFILQGVASDTISTLGYGISGQVLSTNGSAVSWISGAAYLNAYKVYTTTSTWLKPTQLAYVKVIVTGGGGGGAGATSGAGGGGGGAGGTSIKYISSSALANSVTVTIGPGGAAGASAGGAGGLGGTSSFGAHATAAGGSGAPDASGNVGGGGAGGVGASGDINMGGGGGNGAGGAANTGSGAGGTSYHGGGGSGVWNAACNAGQNYGGGGGGGSGGGATARVGCAGAQGVVTVEEYLYNGQ